MSLQAPVARLISLTMWVLQQLFEGKNTEEMKWSQGVYAIKRIALLGLWSPERVPEFQAVDYCSHFFDFQHVQTEEVSVPFYRVFPTARCGPSREKVRFIATFLWRSRSCWEIFYPSTMPPRNESSLAMVTVVCPTRANQDCSVIQECSSISNLVISQCL